MQKEQELKEFQSALRETLIDEQNDAGAGEGGGLMPRDAGTYVNADGTLTEVFKAELRQLQADELADLEDKIRDARPAATDVFGIKRRFCGVCEEDCRGYQANRVLFTTGQDGAGGEGQGEFPTFCRHCGCPAHFHKPEEERVDFPQDLAEQLVSKNIQS